MKKLSRILGCCAFILGVLPFSAFGHEFILKPSASHVKSGEAVNGQVQATHIFMISEEAEPVGDVKLSLGQPFSATEVFVKGNDKEWLDYSFLAPGDAPFVLTGWRKPQVWSSTTKGILQGDRASLEKEGKTVVSVGKYEKFAKTFYNLKNDAKVFTKIQGQRLEIVPVTDYQQVLKTKKCVFKVLLDGKEIAVPVHATYDGFSQKEEEYKEKLEPKADRTVELHLDHKGLWMLRAETTLQKPEEGVDTLNLRSTLVFDME